MSQEQQKDQVLFYLESKSTHCSRCTVNECPRHHSVSFLSNFVLMGALTPSHISDSQGRVNGLSDNVAELRNEAVWQSEEKAVFSLKRL